MKIIKVEDYAITMRIGRSYQSGIAQGRGGIPKKVYGYEEIYRTNVGEFKREDWCVKAREIVEASGEVQLLEDIKKHCTKNCAWLHKESEIEEYALECLTHRAYKHWDGFVSQEPPRVWIFLFDIKEVAPIG